MSDSQPILDQFARIPLNTTIENGYFGVFIKTLKLIEHSMLQA